MREAYTRTIVFKSQIENTQKENAKEKRCDPTTKASNVLIKSLMEQKALHEANNAITTTKSKEKKISRSGSIVRLSRIPKKSYTEEIVTESIEPKSKKIKVQCNEIPDAFGQLKRIDAFDSTYDLPDHIKKIENKTDMSYLAIIEEMIQHSALYSDKYVSAYMALLHLEEAAETMNIERYNQSSLKIHYSGVGRTFQIKIDVRILHKFYTYK